MKREVKDRITVKNVNVPGYTVRVDAGKYHAVRKALVKVLPSRGPGLTQSEMARAVVPHLPKELFPGGAKAEWWVKVVQRDYEAKRIITRQPTKPLRWRRVGAG